MFDSSPTAILFPGQGSQTQDMRALVAAVRPDLLDAAIELIGEDPFPRVEESTRFAQPAILCASLASWTRLRGYVDPIAFAGHSLGEFSALAAAGAILDHDALRLVVLRGDHMARSGEASGGGTMLALLGASPDAAAQLAERHGVSLANDNAPGQVVLSGAPDALDAARADAEAQGLRALPLGVAGAFHSPQMQGAVAPFRAALGDVAFHEPDAPVISCATAAPFADPATELAEALISPVRWRETMDALDDVGSEFYVDAGPGRVLAKLAPRNIRGASAVTAEALLEDIGARV
ncbi:MAG: ACP S-malonyltransferase [Solirubrobacteraceae bacterium]|nr:ACP S-malonyltransferase [Solirubrobacteraceae bacterium]